MKLLRFLLLAISLTTAHFVRAYDLQVDGIYYNADINKMELTVVGGDTPYSGVISIPENVNYNGRIFSVVTLEENSFKNSLITVVKLSKNIKEIPKYAFRGCSKLEKVELLEGLTSIDNSAFYGCSSLKYVNFPQGLTFIGGEAFRFCSSLHEITIPNTVRTINHLAFGESGLKKIIIEDGDSSLNLKRSVFYYIKNDIESVYIGRNLVPEPYTYDDGAFSYVNINTLRFGPKVESIPSYTFKKTKVKNMVIPANIKSISSHPDNIEEVEIIDSQEPLKAYFSGSNMKRLYLGRNIYSSSFTFKKDDMTEITIGEYVTDITDCRFKDVSVISVKSKVPPQLSSESFDANIFLHSPLYVPDGCVETYKTTEKWKNFWTIEDLSKVNVDKIEIRPDYAIISIGESMQLTATLYPQPAYKAIEWKSSNTKIAEVSNIGVVKALTPGKAIITAICGDASSEIEISVYNNKEISVDYMHDHITIICRECQVPVSINLYSVFGQCLYQKLLNVIADNEQIDLSNLDDGVYILQVVSGDKNISKRIVKSTQK